MAQERTKDNRGVSQTDPGAASAPEERRPRSLQVATKGVRTSNDFKELMSGLMSDVIEGDVSPGVCNAACNAGGKLLKVVEMEMRYGTVARGGQKVLPLCADGLTTAQLPQQADQVKAEFEEMRRRLDHEEKAALERLSAA